MLRNGLFRCSNCQCYNRQCCGGRGLTKRQRQQILQAQLRQQQSSFRTMTIGNDLFRNRGSMSTVMVDSNFNYRGRGLIFPNQRTQRFRELRRRHGDIQKTTVRCHRAKYKRR